jgi:hypothetical protein
MKSKGMPGGRVEEMGKKINAYRILVWKSERKILLL